MIGCSYDTKIRSEYMPFGVCVLTLCLVLCPILFSCVFIINPENKLMLSLNYPACVGVSTRLALSTLPDQRNPRPFFSHLSVLFSFLVPLSITQHRNMDEIVRCVEALQLSYEKSVATPANWPQNHSKLPLGNGEYTTAYRGSVFLLPTVSDEDANEHFPGHLTCQVPSGIPYLRLVKAKDVGVVPPKLASLNETIPRESANMEKSASKRKGVLTWFRK